MQKMPDLYCSLCVRLAVQCVGLSAASSLELLFTYLAEHYWWSREGWDALDSIFSLEPPLLAKRDGSVKCPTLMHALLMSVT